MKLDSTLVALRKAKNLSQEKLAEIIGVARQSVAKWETGESLPEIEKLLALSDYFKVTLDALVRESEPCSSVAGSNKSSSGQPDLIEFLIKSKLAGYAGHGAETTASRDKSHDFRLQDGRFAYYDTYLGGERFAGEEAVWENGQPRWCMNYLGRVLDPRFSGDFLKEALALVPVDLPYRGPRLHRAGDYSYHCTVTGEFEWVHGHEEIFYAGDLVYECLFHGGTIQ